MSDISSQPSALRAPIDEEGFVASFDILQEKELVEFYKQYGFVVIRDVANHEQVEKTIDEIWDCPELLKRDSIKRDDPSTWENGSWPTTMGLANGGFLSHFSDVDLPMCWENRQNPKIYRAFELVLGNPWLWVNYDRYGMMRPTKNIKWNEGTLKDKPEWKSKSNWLHWDQNPWREPEFVRVQGLLALSDSTHETGGFHCVPGFTHHFFQWQIDNAHHQARGGLINVPEDDPIRSQIQQIHLRKGSFLIWDSRTPHGNYPNESDSFRIVQYITFFIAPQDPKKNEEEAVKRLDSFYVRVSSGGKPLPTTLTELGEKILGMKSWITGEKIKYSFN